MSEYDDDNEIYTVYAVHADCGSIVQFKGRDADGDEVLINADRRMAQDMADGLAEEGEIECAAPAWAVFHSPTWRMRREVPT